MLSPLIRKLEHGAALTAADRAALDALAGGEEVVGPHQDLVREGEAPGDVRVVLEGFAYRYKMLPDGGRQILAWLAPGEMDHSVGTATRSLLNHLPRNGLEAAAASHPALRRALWWADLVDAAILREWLVNLGRRQGDRRIAHLFCEVLARLRLVGLAPRDVIQFPLTQVDLADTAGLSPVHVNRIVQQLRDARLIAWRGGTLRVLDRASLETFAGFNPSYLHLRRRRGPQE
jgi:CRP-like cAMP-binding protein